MSVYPPFRLIVRIGTVVRSLCSLAVGWGACVVAPAWWRVVYVGKDEGSSGEKEVLLCRSTHVPLAVQLYTTHE
jgi:hypothetical protein